VVVTDGIGLMVRLQVAGKTCPLESVVETVNESGPATVGVPEIAPLVEFNCRPTGSVPLLTVQFL